MRSIYFLAILFVVNVANAGGLVSIPPKDIQDEFIVEAYSEIVREGALDMVNELSSRRRSSVVFPNEQSPFYGVQINFVNVAQGNLTFLTRDMVAVGKMPLVFGKVYDSEKRSNDDFGPGWKLSFTETIVNRNGNYIYRDSANSEYLLIRKGSRLYSQYPHLTGIKGGKIKGNSITLIFNSLEKSFGQYRNRFLLSAVRHSNGGHLTLTYANGLLSRVKNSSRRHIDILRNSKGLIVGAKDDAGRTIFYQYNAKRMLAKHTDLSGRNWSFNYSKAGVLSSVVDARKFKILQVSSGKERKISRVKSQFNSTRYQYDKDHTEVTNGLLQMAGFWHHESGLTHMAQDWSGVKSQIEFDENLKLSSIAYDGKIYASLKYNSNDRVAEIAITDQPGEKRYFKYDAEGRFLSMYSDESILSENQYDANGRIIMVRPVGDGRNERVYHYGKSGSLTGFFIDKENTKLDTDESGQVIRLASDAHSLELRYDRVGKLIKLLNRVDENSTDARFEYPPNGLRNLGRYSISLDELKFTTDYYLDYDAAANFTAMEIVEADGGATTQTYNLSIGIRNELLSISSNGNGIDFQYDGLGRPVALETAHKNINFYYDKVGRLSDVYIDSEHALTSNYGINDVDPAVSADKRTPYTYVSEPVTSNIYGSLESIVYTRKKGTPYGVVRFDHFMARFIVPQNPMPASDAVIHDSLRRRNFIVAEADRALRLHPLLGFDKPSNVLFIPPEFFGVNCMVGCYGSAANYSIDPVANAVAGQAVVIGSSGGSNHCYYNPPYNAPDVRVPFGHSISFGDGTTTFVQSGRDFPYSVGFSVSKAYSSPGTYTVSDVARCECNPLITLATASRGVTVAPPQGTPVCSESKADAKAISALPTVPKEPFERFFLFECEASGSGTVVEAYQTNASFDTDNSQDPCAVTPPDNTGNAVAAGHSHPFFTTPAEMNQGVGCNGIKTWSTQVEVDMANNVTGLNMSPGDQGFAQGIFHRPFYMVTPNRNIIKAHKPSGATWQTVTVWSSP